jgi:hypothetical protein
MSGGEEAIKRKVNEILNLPMDELTESIVYLSEFYENENKNNLKSILEKKSFENYSTLFKEFSKMNNVTLLLGCKS